MDHFTRLKNQVKQYLMGALLISSSLLLVSWWLFNQLLPDFSILIFAILAVEAMVLAFVIANRAANYVIEPVRFLWQAILHVSPESSNAPAPNLNQSKLGRELITSLCLQVYQLASSTNQSSSKASSSDLQAKTIASNLPLPLLVMDKAQTIVFANEAAHKYLRLNGGDLIGKNLYGVLDLSFQTTDSFDKWLSDAKTNTVTSSRSWEHVRLRLPDQTEPLQFDMAAYYNKENSSGVETIITLFDHTASYNQEDNSVGYVALAVHELRTPLTLLRGYIEVFEEELDGKLSPELAGFMTKMQASAQQLAAFANNILNVARVEADQLTLQLHEENWNDIVAHVVDDLKIRAAARNKIVEIQLANNLPPVAADRVSLYEVLSNLIDNAIKYSGQSQKVVVKTALVENGMIETTVEDYGVGIATNILPHLFEKFYRSHHTQMQVGGTGLGLYLSKAIIGAHGGNIWVRSKEGQGTTVGFTIKPYAQLADELKNSDNKEIVRNAYGWIKNHSLYRR